MMKVFLNRMQYEPDAGIRSYKSFIHEFDANG